MHAIFDEINDLPLNKLLVGDDSFMINKDSSNVYKGQSQQEEPKADPNVQDGSKE